MFLLSSKRQHNRNVSMLAYYAHSVFSFLSGGWDLASTDDESIVVGVRDLPLAHECDASASLMS